MKLKVFIINVSFTFQKKKTRKNQFSWSPCSLHHVMPINL